MSPPSHPMRAGSLSLTFFFLSLMIVVGAGCQRGAGTPPDVAMGRYVAHVEGSVEDTLAGPVRYRIVDGRLAGVELGAEDAPGLSVELTPRPLAPRTYEIVGAKVFRAPGADSRPYALAFLRLPGARLRATQGTLEVTYVGDDRIGGQFDFAMEGRARGGAGRTLSVRVTGALDAQPLRE